MVIHVLGGSSESGFLKKIQNCVEDGLCNFIMQEVKSQLIKGKGKGFA